jgi:spore germination cell wall hydrolase CwlJ-like protein
MFVSLRTAFLVIAALTGSSVAPAQVTPATEPLISEGPLPTAMEVIPLPAAEAPDPLSPLGDEAVQPEEIIKSQGTLAETVASLRSSDPGSREVECLAVGIYYEAKSESLKGQLAVGHVIANRAKSGRFPSSYCGVLFQRSQFSFIRGKSLPSVPRASQDWQDAVAIAKIVDQELQPSPMGKALFFHARRVSPGWRLTRVGTVGNHIFYR